MEYFELKVIRKNLSLLN